MNARHERDFELPDDLSDEAAAQLLECLREIARAIENRYFAQIRQHYDKPTASDDEQLPLWDQDPPF
jgi:hypothetical protein